eukprot:12894430-Prorocentrum_lima.AAC.1
MRGHNDTAAVLLKHLRGVGFHIQREEAIPELYAVKADLQVEERFIDVVARVPAAGVRLLIDVAIRSPFSAELTSQAAL